MSSSTDVQTYILILYNYKWILEYVDVGELMGSRRRCHTSEGEDAFIALGEDAEVVVVAVAPSWWCSSRGLLLCS